MDEAEKHLRVTVAQDDVESIRGSVNAASTVQVPGHGTFESPVRKVNYVVEDARLGQTTDYDKLTIEIWTNGAVLPQDSLAMANSFTTIEVAGDFFVDGEIYTEMGAGATDWGGDYTISFPETNQIFLTLNTQLLATSGEFDASFIEASSIRISINAFVPEPTTTGFLALGLAVMAFRRRTRS